MSGGRIEVGNEAVEIAALKFHPLAIFIHCVIFHLLHDFSSTA